MQSLIIQKGIKHFFIFKNVKKDKEMNPGGSSYSEKI